jgi:hypothetical protein
MWTWDCLINVSNLQTIFNNIKEIAQFHHTFVESLKLELDDATTSEVQCEMGIGENRKREWALGGIGKWIVKKRMKVEKEWGKIKLKFYKLIYQTELWISSRPIVANRRDGEHVCFVLQWIFWCIGRSRGDTTKRRCCQCCAKLFHDKRSKGTIFASIFDQTRSANMQISIIVKRHHSEHTWGTWGHGMFTIFVDEGEIGVDWRMGVRRMEMRRMGMRRMGMKSWKGEGEGEGEEKIGRIWQWETLCWLGVYWPYCEKFDFTLLSKDRKDCGSSEWEEKDIWEDNQDIWNFGKDCEIAPEHARCWGVW